jgi:polysaccharide biosynthesis protein PslG
MAAQKGVETDMTWGTNATERDQTAAGVKTLGAKWMRLTLAWHDVETAKGAYKNLGRYDDAFARAVNSGAKIVVTVYTAPKWASGTGERESPPQNPADYADFIRFAATRWGDKVDAWEIWNEQNLKTFWSTGPDAAAYARLLKAAYPAVKGADPSALVVFGGTAYNDYWYVSRAYKEIPNLGDYYDVMATHPYPRPANSAPEKVWYEPGTSSTIATRAFAGYREVRRTMLSRGDDKPIWFTEFGWSSNTVSGWGVSAAQQADYLTRAYRCVEQDPYVQVAIWYIYRNHAWAQDANTWGDQLGLTYTDFTPKPAYNAFKAYTPGSVGCEYQYPQTTPPAEPEPTPEPTDEPTPEPEPTDEEQPEDGVVSSSVQRRVDIRLVRLADARASRRTQRRARTTMRVIGEVSHADRGHVELRLTCRGRGDRDWQRRVTRNADVSRSGRYTQRIRPRRHAKCTTRAGYHAFGERLGRSRVLRFKT